ncbi:uncharacterized protein Z518_02054 [Rhinocladiella mackenziei CBS 650.93]|uniref:Rhinocladiella mackenziei CBS 650.93 unplaced genomic scaffold supercont1.2, whole genome shotgun sequence n=1 Tax=Rhinocladiella mackenziei CBS 650.93 TaxID=1442369 RepID=A0A0D2IVZ2_9EURO|nr:uncharacterized protein Z518_02054 [Rhinocladiella mackenziei CBS 650.93]KIX07401.1 hypothetical protein Z518_02054 [Rhinocladiella mackenziei CBS 650.93]
MADKSPPAPMKRVSRACTFCRARKSRCDLEASGGQPPCGRCKKDGRDCVLGTSNRGGSRVRKKNLSATGLSSLSNPPLTTLHEANAKAQPHPPPFFPLSPQQDTSQGPVIVGAPHGGPAVNIVEDEDSSSTADSTIGNTIPRNPSDAWQLLKDVANREADHLNVAGEGNNQGDPSNQNMENGGRAEPRGSINGIHAGISTYRLVREGYLTAEIIQMLVRRYAEHYHPYLPLVPRKYFDPAQLDLFAVNDKHLLTAVLTISSKDLIEQPNVHICCSRYMHDLISGIAAGHDCEVEAVEALLLLAEWEPQGLRNRIEAVGRGEEDRSAWMHVGIALRTGYFLGLDRTAFRQESAEEARIDGRKRLAWANCYVSDRLISVRIGKAFWSRGPGPMTGLSSQDFPSLQPFSPGDEDYAKIMQATLDLTQLYSNVHDVLYSGMRTSGQMMLMGDYVKYVDDFRAAIARWNTTWGRLECSPYIKVTLQMSYEYLCLYTNAFVFQAAISQAIASKPKTDAHSLRDHLRCVFSNVGAMPDARFIWASVAAAKAYLTLLSTQIDPGKYLRYMPLRYYLYSIYSAVFLYKARSFGVMTDMEERQVRQLVFQAMEVLKRASVSAQDPGSRYARLLELLWMKPPKGPPPGPRPGQSPTASDTPLSSSGSVRVDAQGYMQYSPTNDFSWLDLEAVGDFVSGDPMPGNGINLLAPMAGYQAPAAFIPQAQGMPWQQTNNITNWPVDWTGNLFF